MTTGQLIRAARKNAGMTQAELAQKLGISYVGISQWENDLRNPKPDTLKRIAAALNIKWFELLPEDERGGAIAAYVIENVSLKVKDQPMHKMSDAEAYRAGFLQFHSDEDRAAYFYKLLNEDGKLAAGVCFFRHLDKDAWGEVADFVLSLSENPLYQRIEPPQSPPAPQEGNDTTPPPDAPGEAQEGE